MNNEWVLVIETLEKIARFFDRLSKPTLGEPLLRVAEMIRTGRQNDAVDILTGTSLWGGAGSYVDRVLYPEDGFSFHEEDFGRINAEYLSLLLELLCRLELLVPRPWMAQKKEALQHMVSAYMGLDEQDADKTKDMQMQGSYDIEPGF
jgi:hypothetical protein